MNAPPPEDLETLARTEPAVDEDADGRRRRGNRTRESILQAAADLASVNGLEGLTIGSLAAELGMSKSGLFAHFGSKEELQVATNDAREFLAFLTREVRKAQEAGDIDPTVEAEQIAFELDALGAAAHQHFQL